MFSICVDRIDAFSTCVDKSCIHRHHPQSPANPQQHDRVATLFQMPRQCG